MAVAARAPGKVILCGEHAVVHGSTSIAAAIGLYTRARIDPGDRPIFSLSLPDLNVTLEWSLDFLREALAIPELEAVDPLVVRSCSENDLAQKLAALLENRGVPGCCDVPDDFSSGKISGVVAILFLYVSILGMKAAVLTIESDIPMSCGLGSSAALAVSVAASLLSFSRRCDQKKIGQEQNWISFGEEDSRRISSWAFEAERIMHGNPSGIDNLVCTFGNVVKMKKKKREVIGNLEASLQILVTNTKIPRDTKKLVAGVRQLLEKHPKVIASVFDAIDAISEEVLGLLQSDLDLSTDQERLEELVVLNQGLLGTIGVSHPAIETICKITARYGLRSKLTGGGGGGCVITILPRDLSPKILEGVTGDLTSSGFECLQAEIGVQGVQMLQ